MATKIKKLKKVKGWPDPMGLTKEELADLVGRLQGILWAGEDGKPDDDKEWECDTIEHVADALSDFGMKP